MLYVILINELKCHAEQFKNYKLLFLSFTRNTDIKTRAFIRLMYIRSFSGVNNHNVAFYMIRLWDLHLLDLQ